MFVNWIVPVFFFFFSLSLTDKGTHLLGATQLNLITVYARLLSFIFVLLPRFAKH